MHNTQTAPPVTVMLGGVTDNMGWDAGRRAVLMDTVKLLALVDSTDTTLVQAQAGTGLP